MNRYADFSSGEVVKVHTLQLADFKKIALKNDKQRYRWCNHSHPGDMLQDMFLIRTRGDYVRPDKHINMPESHTIIEGREAIILFSDQGEITDAFLLDRNKGYLSYRINASIYHLTIPLTATAVDYEVKL